MTRFNTIDTGCSVPLFAWNRCGWPSAVRSSRLGWGRPSKTEIRRRQILKPLQACVPLDRQSIVNTGLPVPWQQWLEGQAFHSSSECWLGFPGTDVARNRGNTIGWLFRMKPRTVELIAASACQVALLSSRLPRRLDQVDSWFDAMRTIAMSCRDRNAVWLTVPKTTAHRFVERMECRFGLPLIRFLPFPSRPRDSGCQPRRAWRTSAASDSHHVVYYQSLCDTRTSDSQRGTGNDPDHLLASLASELMVLSVRRGGNTWRATLDRLAGGGRPTTLLMDDQLTSVGIQNELINRGAIGWQRNVEPAVPATWRSANLPAIQELPGQRRVPLVLAWESVADRPDFLVHWTRASDGPWPDQSDDDYLDELIFQLPGRDRSAVAALRRILASRQLLATSRLIRGNHKVVCFSASTLRDIGRRRVYRCHLRRWDFEGYGMAIDKAWLAGRGSRPVIYGDGATWDALSAADRPFFQIRQGRNAALDWSREREWRLPTDLDLRRLPSNRAVVFVQESSDVERIAPWCRWPVVVMKDSSVK